MRPWRVHRQGSNHGDFCHHRSVGGGMVHIYRLIIACLLCFAGSAQAVTPTSEATGNYAYALSLVPHCNPYYTGMGASCTVFTHPSYPGQLQVKGVGGGCPAEWGWCVFDTFAGSPPVCPANSTVSGTGCTCAAGYNDLGTSCQLACPVGQHNEGGTCVPDPPPPTECPSGYSRVNGVCTADPCPDPTQVRGPEGCKASGCPANQVIGDDFPMEGGDKPVYLCVNSGGKSCGVSVTPTYCIKVPNQDGVIFYGSCVGTARFTGSACNPATANGDGSSPGPGSGSGGGTGSGTGTGGTGTGTGTGSGGTEPSPSFDPPDPIPPTESTGKCPAGSKRYGDGNCYPDPQPTTSTDADGNCPTGANRYGNLCVFPERVDKPVPDTGTPENPNPIYGGGDGSGGEGGDSDKKDDAPKSGFGGVCQSGFSCEGDAIQCAIAQEQHRRMCQMFDTQSDESNLYALEKGKTGNQTGDLPGNETISLAGRIDQTNLLGAGACISDVNVTVWGQAVVLPFSILCDTLGILGNILVAVSMLLAGRIVIRG